MTPLPYTVHHCGRAKKSFAYFFEAWLYIYLELPSYGIVYGPNDEFWIVNPRIPN